MPDVADGWPVRVLVGNKKGPPGKGSKRLCSCTKFDVEVELACEPQLDVAGGQPVRVLVEYIFCDRTIKKASLKLISKASSVLTH